MPATRKAVSYKRLGELETQLPAEVEELFALGEQSEQPEVADGLVVSKEGIILTFGEYCLFGAW